MKGYIIAIQSNEGDIKWIGDTVYTDKVKAISALKKEAYHLKHDDGYSVYHNSILGETAYRVEDDYLLLLNFRIK